MVVSSGSGSWCGLSQQCVFHCLTWADSCTDYVVSEANIDTSCKVHISFHESKAHFFIETNRVVCIRESHCAVTCWLKFALVGVSKIKKMLIRVTSTKLIFRLSTNFSSWFRATFILMVTGILFKVLHLLLSSVWPWMWTHQVRSSLTVTERVTITGWPSLCCRLDITSLLVVGVDWSTHWDGKEIPVRRSLSYT